MNFFSTDPFLDALAAARFRGRRCEPVDVAVNGEVYRVLAVDGRPVTQVPFLDFLEPIPGADPAAARALGWVPVALRGTVGPGEWNAAQAPPECEPSPYLSWEGCTSWEDALTRLPRMSDARRKQKKLEAELGPVRFLANDPDPRTFLRCLEWKSLKYRSTGHVDQFADPRNVALFEHLRDSGALVVSALYAGERLAAVHFGVRQGRRFSSWVPAYDPDLQKFSPGRLLLHAMLEDGFRRGDTEFDFLIGDEGYKFEYATHVRIVGPVGTPPLGVRARKALKGAARAALNGLGLLEVAKGVRKRLRGHG